MKAILRYPWLLTLIVTALGWVWVAAAERAVTQSQLCEFERRIDLLQDSDKTVADRLGRIESTVIEVRTDVRWIRGELNHLRTKRERAEP